MKVLLTSCLFFSLLLPTCQVTAKLLTADDQAFQYSGRIDFSTKSSPYLTWPGSSVKARFTGNRLSIRLRDDKGMNYFNVMVGNTNYVIATEQGEKDYWISETLGEGPHTVEIYKRTEGEDGGTFFIGLIVDENEDLQPLPDKPNRRIEIFGDSITSGMGNVAPYNAIDNLGRDKDHYLTYGAITARNLNAELHSISQSGIGLMISWFDFTMSEFYDQLSAVGNNNSQWEFSLWTPDVVVINLFQNDSWIYSDQSRFPEPPSKNKIISAYKAFILKLRRLYPDANIICVLGSMDAVKPGSPWPGYIQSAVTEITNDGDNKLTTVIFPYNGYDAHPRVNQHRINANILTKAIRSVTGW